MSQSLPYFDIQQLNPTEKLELIGQLWDSLPDSNDSLPVPEWHRQELERRLADADANPDAAVPWGDVESRLRQQP